jgi:hypothetical protein
VEILIGVISGVEKIHRWGLFPQAQPVEKAAHETRKYADCIQIRAGKYYRVIQHIAHQ